ncbi:MAG: hypothetical protein JSV22_04685 [Bacteroidales bacterium]|nr:MAG: hypothetical protein JSV22_04685 [Bacteroidales bacterium]
MISLKRKEYRLHNITENDFWAHLDDITVGQNINPEIGCFTPFHGKFENVFGGRKVKNKFSIFLYRPITREFWTKILAKGQVSIDDKKECVIIDCRFEIPFWSILILLLLGLLFVTPFYFITLNIGIIINSIFLLIYGLILKSNYHNIVNELKKQFNKISDVEIPNIRTL